jgi:DNA-binding NarL/FixJ family response regulator
VNRTVLLGDEHPSTRNGVRLALERGGFSVVAEAEDAATVLAVAAEHRPAIALLDVALPGGGIIAVAGMAEASPTRAS